MFVIDGLDAITATYYFAGVVSQSPHDFSLNELWMMVEGVGRQRRSEMLQAATVFWASDKLDIQKFLLYGSMDDTGAGGPVQLSPELEAKVEAEIQRLRDSNPNLPKVKAT